MEPGVRPSGVNPHGKDFDFSACFLAAIIIRHAKRYNHSRNAVLIETQNALLLIKLIIVYYNLLNLVCLPG